jgi:hypothetical protein
MTRELQMIDTVQSDYNKQHEKACQLLREALDVLDQIGLSTAVAIVSQALDEANCHVSLGTG